MRLDRGDRGRVWLWVSAVRRAGGSGCAHTHSHTDAGPDEMVFRGHTVVDSRTHIDTHTTQALNQKYNARIGFFAAGESARRER